MSAPDIERAPYEGWSIMELMGHRRLAGYVRAEEIAGHGMLRIEIPGEGPQVLATQFYSPAALYCLTPTTEEIARAVAKANRPEPVQRWELPQLEAPKRREDRERKCRDCGRPFFGDSPYCARCLVMATASSEVDDDDEETRL